MVLNVGDSAPDFELADTDLKMRKLNEFLDKKVVLSFIVAASSPVCETELCTLETRGMIFQILVHMLLQLVMMVHLQTRHLLRKITLTFQYLVIITVKP